MLPSLRTVTLAASFLMACGGVTASSLSDDAGVDATHWDASIDASTVHEDASRPDVAIGDAGSDVIGDAAIDNDPRCPAAFGATGECNNDGLTCHYAEGRCDCRRPCSGPFIPDASWSCSARDSKCPDDPPAVGTACGAGAHCVYPGCCTTNDFTCVGGKWDAAPPFCPP